MDRGLLSDLAGGGDCQSDDVSDESRMGRGEVVSINTWPVAINSPLG